MPNDAAGNRPRRNAPKQSHQPARSLFTEGQKPFRAVARGVPYIGTYADELNALTMAALGSVTPKSAHELLGIDGGTFEERRRNQLAREHALDAEFDRDHPKISSGLQTGGALAGTAAEMLASGGPVGQGAKRMLGKAGGRILPRKVAGPMEKFAASKGIAPRMAKGLGGGLVLGGIEGFGDAQGGRLANAGNAGLIAGTSEGLTPLAAHLMTSAVRLSPSDRKKAAEKLEGILGFISPEIAEGIIPLPFGAGKPGPQQKPQ